MEFQLRGFPAVAAILVVLGFGAYRMHSMQTTLETDAVDELKFWIVSDYARDTLASLPKDVNAVSDAQAMETAEKVRALERIEFTSINAKGMWKSGKDSDVVVKVDLRVDGKIPPDGEPTRYYKMRYSSISGWRVVRRTSVWSWRLKLF
jgi:hypothetical protein